jgi:pyridinium-3,5-bisthiocarboxylic acid mononucleotide nickel chelatase
VSHDHPHPHSHEAGAASNLTPWAPRQPASQPTPLLYVDCFSGISGDMLLGALLDAGLPLATLEEQLGRLPLAGYRLAVHTRHSYGIAGTKLDVLVDESIQPQRRLRDILDLLDESTLAEEVRTTAAAIFQRLGEAEAAVHAIPLSEVHFHEVGAVDSIVDVVGAAIGLHALGIQRIHASSLPMPGGTVRAQHGLLPAPAPATLEVLSRVGAPTRPAPVQGELVTPTGAAILAELATFEQPMMRVRRVGYGYGTKEMPWPNAVRLWLGEAWAPSGPRGVPLTPRPLEPTMGSLPAGLPTAPRAGEGEPRGRLPSGREPLARPPDRLLADEYSTGPRQDEVVVIEANLDDTIPEHLGYAMERLLAAGALDAFFMPIQMKKNRPGTLLGVIARPDDASRLAEVILRETTTLGVRMRRSPRLIAGRRQETVETPFGPVRVKVKLFGERAIPAPEYEDCAQIARDHDVPLSDVYRVALLAAEATLPEV